MTTSNLTEPKTPTPFHPHFLNLVRDIERDLAALTVNYADVLPTFSSVAGECINADCLEALLEDLRTALTRNGYEPRLILAEVNRG